ncbi:putative mitochondrial-processing peptidase subunit beta [Hibiscus syriacus]|uniref:Mitochondrial-processing peptidase subunit beta n=1 Tax=Hibiscus syriacus TaxID=106335 RepID=A0A6A2ZKX2_HIBSY|nr:putative mitochondrial-processing peptidase subunit beta [Hibiscus syriacus]
MEMKQLLSLASRSHKPSSSLIVPLSSSAASTLASTASSESKVISPPPPTALIYDRLALSVKEKLQNPDARFLRTLIICFYGIECGNWVGIGEVGLLASNGFGHHRDRDITAATPLFGHYLKVEGQTEEIIFDHLHSTAFQYTPLASGAVKHEEVVEQVKKLFTKLSSDPTTASQLVVNEPAGFTSSEVRIINDDVPLAQFSVAFEGASWTDPDSIALMVTQASWVDGANVGGGKYMGSDLAQNVAINETAESMMAFNTNYKDTGLFGVYAVSKPDCLDDLAYAIMYVITKLAHRVSDGDVIRAYGTSPVAEDIGRQILAYGRRIPFAELFARIDAVDPRTIVLQTDLSMTGILQLLQWVLSKILLSSSSFALFMALNPQLGEDDMLEGWEIGI